MPENGDNLPFVFRHFGKISFLLALLYVFGLMLDELCPKSTAAFVYRDVGFTVFVIFAVLVGGGWVLAIPFLALTARKKADEIFVAYSHISNLLSYIDVRVFIRFDVIFIRSFGLLRVSRV